MSGFVKRQLQLGDKQPLHKYKLCNKCEELRPPEGGVQMNPSKWHCAACWTRRVIGRSLIDAKEVKREK